MYRDAHLLSRVEELAAGVERDGYIEESLRRNLAGLDLVALQREVSFTSLVATRR